MLRQLEAADGPAELDPVAGIFYRCLRKALALGADQVGRRNLHVFEQQFTQRAAQHAHLGDGAGRKARHGALEQQAGNAALAILPLGLHEHHAQLAHRAQADVELAAVDSPAARGCDGAGFDVGGVRTDVG
ncbi:hypothetical protein G6F59_015871 [Rhizopus arrhizus]|nr:hypothetical protein G6F59_015871 [Rhizopus arrhizus]